MVLELAIETGTSPEYWENQGSRAILTALDILERKHSKENASPGTRGLGARGPISG